MLSHDLNRGLLGFAICFYPNQPIASFSLGDPKLSLFLDIFTIAGFVLNGIHVENLEPLEVPYISKSVLAHGKFLD